MVGEMLTIGLILGAGAVAVVFAKMKFQPAIDSSITASKLESGLMH